MKTKVAGEKHARDGKRNSARSIAAGLLLPCLLLIGAVGTRHAAWAQAVYGSVVGTVTDNTGAVVPNAKITVTDVSKGTSVTATSSASGDYRVDHLIPDTYTVTIEASGFQKTTVPGVVIYADTVPKVSVKLQIGSTSNTVLVTAAAPLLQTENADVATILDQRAVQNLPNVNRNFTSFELLTPGTSYIGWSVGQATNPQQSEQIEVDGQLPFATGYELDGTDNQDPVEGVAVINPDLDAVSEMKVTSQDYDAEFGKAVAGLVTAQTRSGSNSFHGSAFEFRRSDAQFARDPFTQLTPGSIPSFVYNQFGGAVGGPIKKDKLFFFGDYQGLRERSGTTIVTSVPTALAHSTCTSGGDCNLSDYLNPTLGGGAIYQIYDPASNMASTAGRTAFTNNIIPANRLSTPAINLMKEMPLPNSGSGIVDNYIASGSGGFNTDQFDVRIDDQLTERFHSFGRYTRFDSNLDGAPIFGAAGGVGFGAGDFAGTDNSMDQSVAAGGDYAFSGKWLTDFRFGWYRIHLNEEGPNYTQALGTSLGIPGVNQGNLSLNGGLPQFNIDIPSNGSNGGASLEFGTSANQFLQIENQYQGVSNWTRIAGNHTIKFGADIRLARLYLVGLDNNNVRTGNFTFASSVTQGVTGATASSGLGFGTFVLGDVSAFARTQTQNTTAATHQPLYFFYGQDQWRATRSLTVTYGLRWELYYPESADGQGQGGLLDLNTGNVRIAGYGPWDDSLNVAMDYKHLSPRLGVAWQAAPNTVLRAGYGRSYGQGWSGNTFGEVLTFTYPVQVSQSLNAANNFDSVFNLSNGPPGYTFAPIPSSGSYMLPDGLNEPTRPFTVRIPTLDAWNLTLQQELGHNSSIQLGYVASHGIHNMFDSSNQASPNQPTIAGFDCNPQITIGCAGPTPYSTNDRRPYNNGIAQALGLNYGHPFGWTQDLRYNANEATTSYQSLQVVFNKRFSQGFQILSHYTWSHARAHESDYYFNDPRAGYGNSYYNRKNAFVFTGNWDLPFGHNHMLGGHAPGWLNEAIGGFALNGTVTADGGLPFTPSYNECTADQDIDTEGGPLCRPNNSAPGVSYGLGTQAFDPVAHRVKYMTTVNPLTITNPVQGPYARPDAGTFGNIERDSLWGPGLIDTDLSLQKRFALTERLNMQFTAQAFNLFNHPNLSQPSSCVDCGGSSGYITDIVASQDGTTMRRLQFAARLQF